MPTAAFNRRWQYTAAAAAAPATARVRGPGALRATISAVLRFAATRASLLCE